MNCTCVFGVWLGLGLVGTWSLLTLVNGNDQRGYYRAPCSKVNPCNATRNLTCDRTEKSCLCIERPDSGFVFKFDVATRSCVPVSTDATAQDRFWECEDAIQIRALKSMQNSTSTTRRPSAWPDLGTCKSDHECQVTGGISYSRCNLDQCQCVCQEEYSWNAFEKRCNPSDSEMSTTAESFKDSTTISTSRRKREDLKTKEEMPPMHYAIPAVGIILPVATVLMLGVWCVSLSRSRNKSKNTGTSIALLPLRDPQARGMIRNRRGPHEAKWSDIHIDYTQVYGGGKGGIVYGGTYGLIPVAIKTVKPNSLRARRETYLDYLYQEIEIFRELLPEHENIIKCLAYSFGVGAEGGSAPTRECYLILQLCPRGSLQKFLRNNTYVGRDIYMEHGTEMQEQYSDYDLLHFTLQIASGLEFMTLQRFVHADVALRNILVLSRHRVVIADLGLARRLDEESPTYIKTHDHFPWKWSSPEVIMRHEFSSQSDVWSFGVTAWEIFKRGCEPYEDLMYTATFAGDLFSGLHRLPKPEIASLEMYRLMKKCWYSEPTERIGFTELKRQLTRMVNQPRTDPDQQLGKNMNEYVDVGEDGYLMQTPSESSVSTSKSTHQPESTP